MAGSEGLILQRHDQPAIVEQSWYDHPQYYDIAFRSETRPEADFIEAACRKYCPFQVRRLLEPACGTGRLITELAARGYRMTGLDLSRPSLEYLKRRLARRRLQASIRRDDMADFRLGKSRVDAAYCTFDSFRHLLTEHAARRHLKCVVESLRPGGIHILGFHLLPLDAAEECIERWTGRHGRTRVGVTLRVLATERRRRIETLRVSLLVRKGRWVARPEPSEGRDVTPSHALCRSGRATLRLRHDFPFRMYTAAQFRRLLCAVPSFELCDVYDFWYEIDRPLEFNDDLSDAVFILRRR